MTNRMMYLSNNWWHWCLDMLGHMINN